MNWVLDLILRVANEGYMDALALVDTFGVRFLPIRFQYLVRSVKARASTALEAHFHMDFAWAWPTRSWRWPKEWKVVH